MSERTTIGGTVYESIGSSTSNLLLKSNGTVRVQWGTKLIDLVKNGKIASGNSDFQVSVVEDESEIKSDGVFILKVGDSEQLWIRKDGNKYNLTGTDLYISATTKQNITGEQKEQALSNIGMYFQSYEDLQNSNIKNGIAYVISDKSLYTIQDGLISEFEAKLKTVTVEEQQEEIGEVINSSIKIVLSILDTEYLTLVDDMIIANKDIVLKSHAKLTSEGASESSGYRLYTQGGTSILEVDEIKVRHGLPIEDGISYIPVKFDELVELISNNELIVDNWYLIEDFQNHWKLPAATSDFNRPILVQALTTNSLYEEGKLFIDQEVSIKYDITYTESVKNLADESELIPSRGKIVWMKDRWGNEANFDFLDYYDCEGNPLTTLHTTIKGYSSIFPNNSYNNKITTFDLRGTVIKDSVINNDNTTVIEFKGSDSLIMHDNIIECRNFRIGELCDSFFGNTINQACNITIESSFNNNTFRRMYSLPNNEIMSSFYDLTDNAIFNEVIFNTTIENVTCDDFRNNVINGNLVNSEFTELCNSIVYNITNCKFLKLENCEFGEGDLINITSYTDLVDWSITSEINYLLYDTTKIKEIYKEGSDIIIVCPQDHYFFRGMIMMHSGTTPIPVGWAVCDGGEHTFNGVTSVTPNLVNKFIKAVSSDSEVGEVLNPDLNSDNEFILTSDHLPEHNHPHKEHTHTLGDMVATTEPSGELTMPISYTDNTVIVSSDPASVISEVSGEGITSVSTEVVGSVSSTSAESSTNGSLSGANHSHDVYISGVSVSDSTSEEDTQTWVNKAFKIEPNHYSLIFIMKL